MTLLWITISMQKEHWKLQETYWISIFSQCQYLALAVLLKSRSPAVTKSLWVKQEQKCNVGVVAQPIPFTRSGLFVSFIGGEKKLWLKVIKQINNKKEVNKSTKKVVIGQRVWYCLVVVVYYLFSIIILNCYHYII